MQANSSNKIPNHIAFIPDGNRRWARSRGFKVLRGHEKGIDKIKEVVRWAKEKGIKEITFWGFSTENGKRSKEEVSGLMQLFETKLMELIEEAKSKKEKVKDEKVAIKFYGDIERLPPILRERIHEIHKKVPVEWQFKVNLLLNYGGKKELINAFKNVAEAYKKGKIREINEGVIKKYLWTGEISDPDLIIRTSGEVRLSGFMPFHSTYSELKFIKKYWPEITIKDLEDILKEYKQRERRFGL